MANAPIEIPRDDDFIRDLVDEEEAFWRSYVETGIRPPVTGDDLAFLSRRYPRDSGDELVAMPEVAVLVDRYLSAADRIAELERERDEVRAKLEDHMGTASRLLSPFGDVSWKAHQATTVSWKKYAEWLEARSRRKPDSLAAARSMFTSVDTRRPFTVKPRKEANDAAL